MTGDEVVGIQVNDPTNPIVAGFLPAAQHVDPQWWLERSSYPIEIVDAQRVRVLIKSNELNQKYNSYAVLVTFDCGKGNVIHMISHFIYNVRKPVMKDIKCQLNNLLLI